MPEILQKRLRAPQDDSPQKASKISFKGVYLSLLCNSLYSLVCNIAALLSTNQLWLKDRSAAWYPLTPTGKKQVSQKLMFISCSKCIVLYD